MNKEELKVYNTAGLATNIMGGTSNDAGKVLLWSNGGSTYNCGIAFYFETE